MSNREKILFFAVLVLLAVFLFNLESIKKKNELIKINEILINSYKERINSSNLAIDSLNAVLLAKKNIDTVIITKYKQKIDSVYAYNYNDYVIFYDTLLNTNVAVADTFLCFDSMSVQKLTIKLVKCNLDSELLANCYIQNNLYSNIINIQDSVISLKDSVNASLEDIYKQKNKKIRRQRNVATGVAFIEFLILIGVLVK